ncbi:hypothetical protein Tco_0612324 [Tanacetum coccineum]
MGSKILVAGNHADNLGYQCDWWRIRWQDKASISSLSTRGGKMGGLGKLVTSQNSVETKLINWSQYKERGSIPIWSNYFKKQDGGESELQQASVSSTKLISISDKRMSTLLNNLALAKRWHLNFLAVVHYKHIREITFGVLTKIDLMDKGTDAVDWEKNYYISSIAGSNNGSSLCGHVKRNLLHDLLQIDADRLQVGPLDEDEENQCIRLLSCCKRHSPNRSIERVALDERMGQLPSQQSDNVNPSGCAHTGMSFIFVFVYRDNRRGRKEPEALAAASLKRVYVENRPYLVGGFCQHDTVANINKNLMLDAESIVSMSEKYIYMRKTFRKTLAFATVLVVEENVKKAAKHESLECKRKYEVALSKQKASEKQASSEVANLKARSSAAEARLTAAREQTLSAQEEAGEWKRKYDVAVKEAKSALEKTVAVQYRACKQTQIEAEIKDKARKIEQAQ